MLRGFETIMFNMVPKGGDYASKFILSQVFKND